jgi:hypothetical protein
LHLAVAPVGSVLLAAAVGAFIAVDAAGAVAEAVPAEAAGTVAGDIAGALAFMAVVLLGVVVLVAAAAAGAPGEPVPGEATGTLAGEAAVAGAAAASAEGLPFAGFCTPPWPLQAPRPEVVEVVPSLQVLGVDAVGAVS